MEKSHITFFIIFGKFTLEKIIGDTENIVFLNFEDFRKIRAKEKGRKMGNMVFLKFEEKVGRTVQKNSNSGNNLYTKRFFGQHRRNLDLCQKYCPRKLGQ